MSPWALRCDSALPNWVSVSIIAGVQLFGSPRVQTRPALTGLYLQAKDNERVTCFVENEAGGKFAIGSLVKVSSAVPPVAPEQPPDILVFSRQGKTDQFSLGKGLVLQLGSKASDSTSVSLAGAGAHGSPSLIGHN